MLLENIAVTLAAPATGVNRESPSLY
jgi:hypothetical protein